MPPTIACVPERSERQCQSFQRDLDGSSGQESALQPTRLVPSDAMSTALDIALVLATLAGGTWAAVALAGWVKRKRYQPKVPVYSQDVLRRRLRILAIDDTRFIYESDFARDGYQIEVWNRLDSYSQLEGYIFDVLILDIRGIAKHLSNDDGLGVLNHVRRTMNSMATIVYSSTTTFSLSVDTSNADEQCDVVGGDYQQFRAVVDKVMVQMTDVAFFTRHFKPAVGPDASHGDVEALEASVRAILLDPSTEPTFDELSSRRATQTGLEILRHVTAVSKRLHGE